MAQHWSKSSLIKKNVMSFPFLEGPLPIKEEHSELRVILVSLSEYFNGLSGMIGENDREGKMLLNVVLGELKGFEVLIDDVKAAIKGIEIPAAINKTVKTGVDGKALDDIKNQINARMGEIIERIDDIEIRSLKDIQGQKDGKDEIKKIISVLDKSLNKKIDGLGKFSAIKAEIGKKDLEKLESDVVGKIKPLIEEKNWTEIEAVPTRDRYGFIQKWTVKKV